MSLTRNMREEEEEEEEGGGHRRVGTCGHTAAVLRGVALLRPAVLRELLQQARGVRIQRPLLHPPCQSTVRCWVGAVVGAVARR